LVLRDLSIATVVMVFAAVAGANYLGTKTTTGPEGELLAVSDDVAAVPAPDKPTIVAVMGQTVTLASDGRGHFEADLEIEGVRVAALVDTGASVIALPQSTAEKFGIFLGPTAFKSSVVTANGEVRVAPVTLRQVRVGGILVKGVEAVVLPDQSLQTTLLGMSFLRRLKSFEINGNTLTLSN
jgi:aspartyl protease family protein